jgi:arylsulfatase A-like enzyme
MRESRREIMRTAALGLAGGATFGGVDASLSYLTAPGYRPLALLLAAWLVAALAGAAAGTALGALLHRLGRGALGPPLVAWALLAAVVNLHVLRVYRPDALSIRVLGVDLALLILLALWLRSIRRGRPRVMDRLTDRLGLAGPRLALVGLLASAVAVPALVAGTGGFGRRAVAGTGSGSPNVLWLVLDTTRADALSCYGNERVTTAALDRLARGGVRFEKAYAAASWTLPSHASMFTGTYPSTHGLTGLVARFDGSRHLAQRDLAGVTVAEVFRRAGYATLAFSENPWVARGTSLGKGFEEFHDVWDLQGRRFTLLERTLKWAQSKGWLPWTVSRYTVASVERRLADLDAGTPFFVFVNFLDPHAPYTPAAAQRRASLGSSAISEAVKTASNDPLVYVARQVELSRGELDALHSLYEAEVAYLDDRIGELMSWLEESGLLDDTIVVVTSDHGENFGWQHLTSHAFAVNDELLRVPLILHAPGRVPSGRNVDTAVSLVDLFPTVAELAGVPFDRSDELEGRSLLRLIEGREIAAFEKRPIFAEDSVNAELLRAARKDHPSFDWSIYERPLRAVRQHGLKYVWSGDGRHGLYDVAHDPLETDNLLSRRPEQARALAVALDEWQRSVEGGRPSGRVAEPRALEPATEQTLRSLGYIE